MLSLQEVLSNYVGMYNLLFTGLKFLENLACVKLVKTNSYVKILSDP